MHGLRPRLEERGSRLLNLFNPEPNPHSAPRRDQDRVLSKAKKAADKQILELSVALEITKFQRDAYREQIAKLEQRLADVDRRAERAEERLHEATLMLSNLAMQAMNSAVRLNATEVLVDGKSILRLNNPINSVPRLA